MEQQILQATLNNTVRPEALSTGVLAWKQNFDRIGSNGWKLFCPSVTTFESGSCKLFD
jgi:hypothetical protein